MLMAMVTGARKGELLNLRWSGINFKESFGFLGDTENGTSRELHFPPSVMTQLKRFQKIGNELIFPSEEKPQKPMDIRKA
jgi:integrase